MESPGARDWLLLGGGGAFLLTALWDLARGLRLDAWGTRARGTIVRRQRLQSSLDDQSTDALPLFYITVRFKSGGRRVEIEPIGAVREAAARIGAPVRLIHPAGDPEGAIVAEGALGGPLVRMIIGGVCVAIGLYLRR